MEDNFNFPSKINADFDKVLMKLKKGLCKLKNVISVDEEIITNSKNEQVEDMWKMNCMKKIFFQKMIIIMKK